MERLLVFMPYYSQQVKWIKMSKSQGGAMVAGFIFNQLLLPFPTAHSSLLSGRKNFFHFMNMVYVLAFLYETEKCPRTIFNVSIMN